MTPSRRSEVSLVGFYPNNTAEQQKAHSHPHLLKLQIRGHFNNHQGNGLVTDNLKTIIRKHLQCNIGQNQKKDTEWHKNQFEHYTFMPTFGYQMKGNMQSKKIYHL